MIGSVIKKTLLLIIIGALLFLFVFFQKQKPVFTPIDSQNQPEKKSVVSLNPPTLESIFSNDHTWVATLAAERKKVIIATGDIIPARSVNKHVRELNNFKWPYEKTAALLKSADLTFINLETPLLEKCSTTDSGMVFCGDLRHVEGLNYSGVGIANLGNNHAGNYGRSGVLGTVNLLKENGIEVTGVTGPVFKEIKGTKFAFLGFNDITKVQPGVTNAEEETIKAQIQEAKKRADLVIVQFHWGVEYRALPDERQIYLGHLAIDSGADLVIGNHPHWIQPIEYYHGKLITYAHGNFIFDQIWSEETQQGVVGKYTFYDKRLVDVEYFPVRIASFGQPYLMIGEKRQKIIDYMKLKSEELLK